MARARAPKLVKLTEYSSKRGIAMVPLSVPRVVRSKLPRQVYSGGFCWNIAKCLEQNNYSLP